LIIGGPQKNRNIAFPYVCNIAALGVRDQLGPAKASFDPFGFEISIVSSLNGAFLIESYALISHVSRN
jgi:hypothetical protein